MPIVRKQDSDRQIERLTQKLASVEQALQGKDPSANLWSIYAQEESAYLREFRHINERELRDALAGLETVIAQVKKISAWEARTLGSAG